MGSDTWRADEWPEIVEAIRNGDPSAGARLAARERKFDNYFRRFTFADYQPVVTQGGNTITYSLTANSHFSGLRVGNMVFLNFRAVTTAAGAAGSIAFSVPSFLPMELGTFVPLVGHVLAFQQATITCNFAAAFATSSLLVGGYADRAANFLGLSPAFNVASGDTIGYNLQYMTSAML